MKTNRRDFLRSVAVSSSAVALLCSGTGVGAAEDDVHIGNIKGVPETTAAESAEAGKWLKTTGENMKAIIKEMASRLGEEWETVSVMRIPTKDLVPWAGEDGELVTVMHIPAKSLPKGFGGQEGSIAIVKFPAKHVFGDLPGAGENIGIVRIPSKDSIAELGDEVVSVEVVKVPGKAGVSLGDDDKQAAIVATFYYAAALSKLLEKGGKPAAMLMNFPSRGSKGARAGDILDWMDLYAGGMNTNPVPSPSAECLLKDDGWSGCFGVSTERTLWYTDVGNADTELEIRKEPPSFWQLRSLAPRRSADYVH